MSKSDILSLTRDELRERFLESGLQPYRADQVFQWLYRKGVSSFEDMTNLPRDLRSSLADVYSLEAPLSLVTTRQSSDGSVKLAFHTHDGLPVESVLIPASTRTRRKLTLCVSTQSGCAMGCVFCATARIGLRRSLTPAEIVAQITESLRFIATEEGTRFRPEDNLTERWITNLVFMGMGEPLHNFRGTTTALRILMDTHGLGFSSRRITVSTVGLVPKIREFGRLFPRVGLAVSLNAPTDALRDRLMPVNRTYNLRQLKKALREYPLPPRRRITIEYVLFRGINDSMKHARQLLDWIKGLRVKINVIPYNPDFDPITVDGVTLEPPAPEEREKFANYLREHDVTVLERRSFGSDIGAACGQLSARELRNGEITVVTDPEP